MKKIAGLFFAFVLSCPSAAFAQGTSRLVSVTTFVVTEKGEPVACGSTGQVMMLIIKGSEPETNVSMSTTYLFCQPKEVIPQVDANEVKGLLEYLQRTGNTVPWVVVPDDTP